MKAQRAFVKNYQQIQEEIQQEEKLGLINKTKTPISVTYMDYFFNLAGVTSMFKTLDGYINIVLYGESVLLKFETPVYNKIKKHLMRS